MLKCACAMASGPVYLLNEVDRQLFLTDTLGARDRRVGGPEFESQEISNSNCFFFSNRPTDPKLLSGMPVKALLRYVFMYYMCLCIETHEPLSKAQHPMYITSSNSYGSLQLTVEMTPNSFHGRSQKFSEVSSTIHDIHTHNHIHI